MSEMTAGRRWVIIPLTALATALAVAPSAPAQANKPFVFFEEAAEAFWAVPHTCADGAIVEGTLLVRSTRFIEAPATEDPDPTARVQFLAVCPGGLSFSWGAPTAPATITSRRKLEKVTAVGAGVARDILGVSHQVTFDVTYRGVGPLEVIRNAPGSTTKIREATANGVVTFDGIVLVNGPNNHPTRPAPFIRTDLER